ncbi:MAG: HlyD family efflux transporter periplasmic adaptor subunit [Bifidobacteriaceae bacterium]|jgi:HlyD family secretion protein|nr:HlyD family efflux transporter periplasmic adaptor subunit [Bifidobacteriaceae bacterium]
MTSDGAKGRRPGRRPGRRRRLLLPAALTAVALGAVGTGAYALARPATPGYRTAVATSGSVVQQASGVGTIGLVSEQEAAFQVAGTVMTVAVGVGDTVAAGQTLATLDPADLDESVAAAEEALTEAEEQLAADLEAQASGGTSAAAAATSAATPASGLGGQAVVVNAMAYRAAPAALSAQADGGAEEVTAAIEAVKAAQVELLAQYDAVGALLEAAAVHLETSQTVCADFLAAVFPPASGEDGEDGAAELAAIQQALIECQAAIAQTQGGQSELAEAEAALADKATVLNTKVEELEAAVNQLDLDPGEPEPSQPEPSQPEPSQPEPSGGGQDQTPGGTPSGGALGQGGASATVTAEQILSDQAQIKLLEAELAIAVQQRQGAVLTAAIGGTVLAVNAAAGQDVTAGQSVAVIDGGDGFTVALTLPVATVKQLSVGDPAVITTASTDQELTGEIASIGVTNLSSTSVPSFAVVLAVDQTDAVLFDGASAAAVITVASSEAVVTVPTSAVHISGTEASVQVLRGSELVDTPVGVGALGAESAEITAGLEVGDVVVLADLSKDVIEQTSSSGTRAGGARVGPQGFQPGADRTIP